MHGAHGAGECRNRYLFDRMPPYLRDRALGVGAPIALKCNAHREIARLGLTRRVRSRTVPVQTLRFQHDCPEVNVNEEGCRSARGSLKRESPRDWRRPGVLLRAEFYSTARDRGLHRL